MDYIYSQIERRTNFLKASQNNESLKVQLQSEFEYLLLLLCGYFWNKNISNIKDENDREFVNNNIFKPSIGGIVSICRRLDLEKQIFGNRKIKKLSEVLDSYPQIRNEKIGHGFSFEDDTLKFVNTLESLIQTIKNSDFFLFSDSIDFVLVTEVLKDHYIGIIYKADGINYSPWFCPKSISEFEVNCIYVIDKDNQYHKISPFIYIKDENEFYTFCSVQEKLNGRTKYNRLLKTGTTLLDVTEFSNVNVMNDEDKRRTLNGTIINNFDNNFKKYIDVGIKSKIKDFIIKNKSSVFATVWGHGGVGKTASIQSLCEDLSNQDSKIFDYIIFVTAKDRYYNYYKGAIETLQENYISTLNDIVIYINRIILGDGRLDPNSIINFDGYVLLIIDDFETFNKTENNNIVNFIKSLNINKHKVILTTRAATLITGEEIQTNELTKKQSIEFLREAIRSEVPYFNLDLIEKDLNNTIIEDKIFEITSGRPLFILQFAILLGQKGSLEQLLDFNIKNRVVA